MALVFLLVLIGIPVAEIFIFAEVGGEIGGWATVGLTLLTAAMGALLFRSQGTTVLKRAQASLEKEESPLKEIVDGVGLLLAALFLFLPGFLTDSIGFLLFIPPLRLVLIGHLFRGLSTSGRSGVWVLNTSYRRGESHSGSRDVIDGEYEDLTPDKFEESDLSEKPDDKLPPARP